MRRRKIGKSIKTIFGCLIKWGTVNPSTPLTKTLENNNKQISEQIMELIIAVWIFSVALILKEILCTLIISDGENFFVRFIAVCLTICVAPVVAVMQVKYKLEEI